MKAGMKGEFGGDGVVRDVWAGLTIDPGSLVQLHLRAISKNHHPSNAQTSLLLVLDRNSEAKI